VGRIKADDEFPDTVKPVLRGHLWGKEKVVVEDRWPLKRGMIHLKFECNIKVKTVLRVPLLEFVSKCNVG
jgi:hypothetical protein